MKATEITEPGFYWWQCPKDDGPEHLRGRPPTVVQIGMGPFNIVAPDSAKTFDCFIPGDNTAWITKNLPGEFIGPLPDPFA